MRAREEERLLAAAPGLSARRSATARGHSFFVNVGDIRVGVEPFQPQVFPRCQDVRVIRVGFKAFGKVLRLFFMWVLRGFCEWRAIWL